jgi:hypothetical protein
MWVIDHDVVQISVVTCTVSQRAKNPALAVTLKDDYITRLASCEASLLAFWNDIKTTCLVSCRTRTLDVFVLDYSHFLKMADRECMPLQNNLHGVHPTQSVLFESLAPV